VLINVYEKQCSEFERIVISLSGKRPNATSDSIELTRLYHERYLNAISSPLRRKILRVLKQGPASIEQLSSKTGIENEALKWHLDMLEHGFCVEKEKDSAKLLYELTQEGKVVDFME
jgi:DNA-binding HxlR family transcriptional regulator